MRIVLLVALVACSGSDEEARQVAEGRGAQGFVGAQAPMPTPAERRAGDRFHQTRPTPRVGPGSATATAGMESSMGMEARRNFEAELRGAAGSPMSCGEMGGLTGEIVIPLTATVSQQGRVTRASVGGAIPVATRECMRRRIEAHRFAPIEDGPRSISASLTVRGTPGETMMEEAPMTGFALQQGQQGISGPTGMSITATMGTPITGYGTMQAGSLTIMGPSGSTISQMTTGVTIMGPTGTSIAN